MFEFSVFSAILIPRWKNWIVEALGSAENSIPHDADLLARNALPCDRWIASSALQKTIRRAEAEVAQRRPWLTEREPKKRSRVKGSTIRDTVQFSGSHLAPPPAEVHACSVYLADHAGTPSDVLTSSEDLPTLLQTTSCGSISVDCNSIGRRFAGIVISIQKSKTDQERRGGRSIPKSAGRVCPIAALDAWLKFANIHEGPVFRPVTRRGDVLSSRLSPEAVAPIIKKRSRLVASSGVRYSGHSLRAGFVTSAATAAGVPAWKIKAQTGHASEAALGRYIRNCELFAENPVTAVL